MTAVRDGGVLRLRIHGPAVASGRIAVDDFVVLVRQVQTGIERIALVLRGEQGMRPGRRPAGIERLTRLEVVALEPGSVVVALDLRPWLRKVLVLPYDAEVVRAWGRLVAEMERRGRRVSENDGWIAACCLSRGLPLMTRNRAHFQHVPALRLVP